MKIKKLFEKLTDSSDNDMVREIFQKSGMVNDYNKLDYGFFPLGSGIFTDNSLVENAELDSGGVLVLGNDFGTVAYVREKCRNKREDAKASATIRNLLKLNLKLEHTFFTNFYLGLRADEKSTMTQRAKSVEDDYKKFCNDFFKTQLEYINPRIIICLGKDVRSALLESYDPLVNSYLNTTLNKKILTYPVSGRKFIFIPHPSFAHINWKGSIKDEIMFAIHS